MKCLTFLDKDWAQVKSSTVVSSKRKRDQISLQKLQREAKAARQTQKWKWKYRRNNNDIRVRLNLEKNFTFYKSNITNSESTTQM